MFLLTSTVHVITMKVFSVAVFVVVGLVLAHAMPAEHIIDTRQVTRNENALNEGNSCSQSGEKSLTCVAINTLNKLQDVTTQDNIEILPGITLSSDISRPQRRARQQKSLEISPYSDKKVSRILDMMYNIMSNLISGRMLKIKMSENTTNSVMRAFEEGRGKMKKLVGPLMMALGAKFLATIPIMVGGLALFASKAMVISKLAFVLSLILGVQYMLGNGGGFLTRFGQNAWNSFNGFGNGHGGYGGYGAYGYGYAPGWNNGWNGATSQNYPYARAMKKEDEDISYSAHK